jgi:hypothetical protein
MTPTAKKIRNILIGIFVAIVAIVATLIIFISPIAKYLIEKYDVKYLGRDIRMDWIYINPFTGYIYIHGLKIYEAGGMDTIFISAKSLSVNFAMLKIFKKTYEIENVTLTEPWGRAIQNHRRFNFNDIIVRFSPKDTIRSTGPPVHFNILNIKVVNGEFHYEERSIPVSYYIKNVNIECPGKRWDNDTMNFKLALQSGPTSGTLNATFNLDVRTLDYSIYAKINKYELNFLQQYLRDLATYGSFTANLDGDVQSQGNFGVKLAIKVKGWLALNDFHYGKVPGDDYLSFDRLMVSIVDVDPLAYSYYIDTIRIDRPFFKYEIYDHMDNISALFGKDMKNIKAAVADDTKFNLVVEIGKYVSDIIKNFIKSYYKVNRLAIYQGNVEFNDFALREQFSIAADPLTLTADSIDKHRRRMNIHFNTAVKPYGQINASLSMDPSNYGTFDLDYSVVKIPVSLFNPFLLSYTSFPLDRGSLDFSGHLNSLDSNINSENHLLILDPRVGHRIRAHDTKWIPMPLIMSIVRERSGAIDYEIPIRGTLRNPKFKLSYVIFDILGNIFTKPPSSAYLFHVKEVQNNVENFLALTWETRQSILRGGQEAFLGKVVKFLRDSPQASITVSPMEYTEKEKEYILFFEAKKKFWKMNRKTNVVTEDDSIDIDRMSVKDSAFVRYLDGMTAGKLLFTIQGKCTNYIGQAIVDEKYAQLMIERHNTFMGFFEGDLANRVKINPGKTIIPFDGFSYYRIDYDGQIPQKLTDAYNEINEINDQKPRRQYLKDRKRNGGLLPEAKLPLSH